MKLLLDCCRGVYIPRDFVAGFDVEVWGLKPDSWAVKTTASRSRMLSKLWGLQPSGWAVNTCQDPGDDPDYWEAWEEILDKASYTDNDGHEWRLWQDGDLWAVCYDLLTDEERKNFEFY